MSDSRMRYITNDIRVWKDHTIEMVEIRRIEGNMLFYDPICCAPGVQLEDNRWNPVEVVYIETNGDPVLLAVVNPDGKVNLCVDGGEAEAFAKDILDRMSLKESEHPRNPYCKDPDNLAIFIAWIEDHLRVY
jgi:hypothetical protein